MPKNQAENQAKAGRGIINDKMKKAQFKKGRSGNPKGRPKKGSAIADILNKIGDETIVIKDGKEMTKREALLRKVYERAFKGESWAVHFIADRTEGKPKQEIGFGDDDLIIKVTLGDG